MSAKNTVIGTTKQIVAEIVGDGALAVEGSRQARSAIDPAPADPSLGDLPLHEQSVPLPSIASRQGSANTSENRFATLLGHAALKVWPDLPRDAQEQLFAAAVDDGIIANDLAEFLHDHHPRTAHPPRPTRIG